ncbi:DUF91 domain-containing protein [Candidatus Dojkabacteria bacterium]|nr:DUF91 domain-containing protein [Candidatus Dojkabacteria bacterium]
MPTFTIYKPSSEKELHGIIEKELDALEEGLSLLNYEFASEKGKADFLCVDSGGRLTIIEVKLHEDENVLFQALRYFSSIDKNRYNISALFPEKHISPDEQPRLILIAERFSDDIKRLSTLVKPEVELYEYTVAVSHEKKKGIIYHSVDLPIINEPLPKPPDIEFLKSYLTIESLKPIFEKMRNDIKVISDSIDEYVTHSYVGYKYKGRQIAWVQTHRKVLDIGSMIINEEKENIDNEYTRLSSDTENYSEIIEKIKKSFVNLGGKLTTPP